MTRLPPGAGREPMSPRLVVNADDFGLTIEVNQGIVEAWRDGIVTSASIMACGDAFEHAVRVAGECPALDVGVHLTLVEEKPVSPPRSVPSLLGPDGGFFPHVTVLARRHLAGRVRREEVRDELRRQIERVLGAGLRISHLDSHQHVHVLPGLGTIVRDLAREFGVERIRHPHERLRGYMLRDRVPGRLAAMLALNLACASARPNGLRTADQFAGSFFAGRLNRRNLFTVIDHLSGPGTCELMCHPGRPPRGDRYAHWNYDWREELAALTDPAVRDYLQEKGIRLASWREL